MSPIVVAKRQERSQCSGSALLGILLQSGGGPLWVGGSREVGIDARGIERRNALLRTSMNTLQRITECLLYSAPQPIATSYIESISSSTTRLFGVRIFGKELSPDCLMNLSAKEKLMKGIGFGEVTTSPWSLSGGHIKWPSKGRSRKHRLCTGQVEVEAKNHGGPLKEYKLILDGEVQRAVAISTGDSSSQYAAFGPLTPTDGKGPAVDIIIRPVDRPKVSRVGLRSVLNMVIDAKAANIARYERLGLADESQRVTDVEKWKRLCQSLSSELNADDQEEGCQIVWAQESICFWQDSMTLVRISTTNLEDSDILTFSVPADLAGNPSLFLERIIAPPPQFAMTTDADLESLVDAISPLLKRRGGIKFLTRGCKSKQKGKTDTLLQIHYASKDVLEIRRDHSAMQLILLHYMRRPDEDAMTALTSEFEGTWSTSKATMSSYMNTWPSRPPSVPPSETRSRLTGRARLSRAITKITDIKWRL